MYPRKPISFQRMTFEREGLPTGPKGSGFHLTLGEGTSLIRTNHRNGTKCFHSGKFTDNTVLSVKKQINDNRNDLLGHTLDTNGHDNSSDGNQTLEGWKNKRGIRNLRNRRSTQGNSKFDEFLHFLVGRNRLPIAANQTFGLNRGRG